MEKLVFGLAKRFTCALNGGVSKNGRADDGISLTKAGQNPGLNVPVITSPN